MGQGEMLQRRELAHSAHFKPRSRPNSFAFDVTSVAALPRAPVNPAFERYSTSSLMVILHISDLHFGVPTLPAADAESPPLEQL